MSTSNVVEFPAAGPVIAQNWATSSKYMGFDTASYNSEKACLGSCLINPRAIHEVVDVLGSEPGVFTARDHQRIYTAFLSLWKSSRPIDVVIVLEMLRDEDEAPVDGWPIYLAELAGTVPTSSHARHYAENVMQRYRVLESVETCKYLANSEDPDTLIPMTVQKLQALTKNEEARHLRRVSECTTEVVDELEQFARGVLTSARATGYAPLDTMLRGGLHEGEMCVLAGRPSHGKSALALNIGYRAAKRGTPVIVFSLEMSKESIVNRLLGIHGGVNMRNIQNGWRADVELRKARACEHALRSLPFYIDDTGSLDISRIAARAQSFVQRHPKALIVVDYLQLIHATGKFNAREAEVSHISRALKRIARDTATPVLCACQLSRDSEKEKDHYRKLAYLRESGSIEQDADVVMILSRLSQEEIADYMNKHNMGPKEKLDETCVLCVAKQRNGPIGKELMYFNKWTQRFEPFDGKDENETAAPERQDLAF